MSNNPSKKPDLSQYNYGAISSLVLTADRSALPRRDKEPDGAPTSLAGRIDVKDMGSRVVRSVPEMEKKKKKAQAKESGEEKPKRSEPGVGAFGYADIIEATQDVEGLTYRPRTTETRQVYELILSEVHSLLGGQAQDIVRSAADTVLETLKNENMKDFDKKKEVEEVLGRVNSDVFDRLVGLGKKITDWNVEDEELGDPDDEKRKDAEIDDEVGVAVVFDEEDEEEEEEEGFEVRDDESDDDDNEDADADDDGAPPDAAVDSESLVIGGHKTQAVDKDIVSPHSIDGFWVQRQVSEVYPDPVTAADKAASVLSILASESSLRDCENQLMELFDYQSFHITTKFLKNRDVIVWCTKLVRSDKDDRLNVEVAMREKAVGWILRELAGDRKAPKAVDTDVDAMQVDQPSTPAQALSSTPMPKRTLDLASMAFSQGSHLMSNKKTKLPEGSFKRAKKGYEEIHVPAPKARPEPAQGELVLVADMPEWTRAAFTVKHLNRVQSKVYPVAFGTDEPILLCAPTGAGKTNVALLTILNELSKWRESESLSSLSIPPSALSQFKIIYIAPMKALVQEMVGNFRSRLGPDTPYGLVVGELTGDSQMTKEQVRDTQIIVTTPEKWDVVTRKGGAAGGGGVLSGGVVRLIIIDEIHLLHDERGPVLESIVSRTLRDMSPSGGTNYTRLIGLSATLPNFPDVASFLHVDPSIGLFHFDSSYRPCGLQQQFIGVSEKKAIKRYQITNQVCYEKLVDQASRRNQTLVFVHSRKETGKTARYIRDTALEQNTITTFVKPDGATREILTEESANVKDPVLRDLLAFGIGIHHAGLSREDRALVEELFADGSLMVLVCTATLAWGVNLPAHTVIIKGTQIYDPSKGKWIELSPQDTLQMLGRAGRPQYDTYGEGIVITNHSELQYYLSLINAQLPIESQLIGGGRLVDALNAEVVMGNVRGREEGVEWLGYTYFYVRMLKNPSLYSVSADYIDPSDPTFLQKRSDIIHTAAVLLEKAQLLKYNRATGAFQSTELGKIASHYYVTYNSMQGYNKHLRSGMGMLELCRVFAGSEEFRLIPVRQEEKIELAKLLERVPIPVKESVEEPAAKINVLLQAYISNLKLDGFVLVADMVYVQQSAGRIIRAMFEICLKRGWAVPAKACLDLCKMVEKRMWGSMTPLRQFKGVPAEVVRKAEGKQFPWYRYFDLSPPEIGELINLQNAGRLVHRLVHSFPKLQLTAQVQPITRSLLRIELSITPDFRWDEKIHGGAETFWIIVEDVDGEIILYHDTFLLLQRYAQDDSNTEHTVTFTVPMFDSPVPPNYYISLISDRWLHAETRLPISFKHLILPEKFPSPTPLLELQPLPLSALHNAEFEAIYAERIQTFNKIQTQVFQALYTSDENVFIGAPTGSGKTLCAEFALLRLWSRKGEVKRAVCIEPYQEMVDMRVQEWKDKFGRVMGGKEFVSLTGETSADLMLLEKGDVIVCTPSQWDVVSRRWRQRKNVQTLGLLIADEVHLVGGEVGPTYEVILSRTRYVSAQTEIKTRIVACGVSLANARDLGEWIGVPSHAIFNFSPSARPLDMDIHLQSFTIPHFPSLMLAMSKPAYLAITEYAPTKPVIVFVPSRKQCRLTVDDLLAHCAAADEPDRFLNVELEDLQVHLDHLSDEGLKETLKHGIGYFHEALSRQDKRIMQRLFESGAVQVLVASKDTAWSLPVSSYMTIIMGVQFYEGKEHRYIDYPVMDVLQMMGRACRPREDERSRCVLMCQQTKKDFYKKFLAEGLPIESHLTSMLHDYFLAEIAVKTIENKQDAMDILTWTYFYRRMTQNPNYYNLHNVSHQHLSEHLSELVETTLTDLMNSKCIAIEDESDEVSPLNLGMIAAYYNISYVTVEVYTLSLKERTKLKGLLEVVSSSAEFEIVPIRRHEDVLLRRLYDRLPVKLEPTSVNYESPHFKTFLLLQAHFSRIQLSADLVADQRLILEKVLNLLSACVDVLSSNAWLNALSAMDLAQMCVQAVWDRDSPLKQIPHFEMEVVKRCTEAGIESVYDVMDMEDDKRTALLQMSNAQMQDVAAFVNSYPSLDVSPELVKGDYTAGVPIVLKVTLGRDIDEDDVPDPDQTVVAPYYPTKKMPNWWLVVGEPSTRQLLVIKRVTVNRTLSVKLEFTLPKGKHDIKLYVICDSYVGADHDIGLGAIDVAEGEDSDSDEDDSDDAMEE
ncbi:Sec63 Brl domain-containing protein [Rhodocollybia butyracea]|uniref:U5 small nuclear ribonucleoprotein 200 kDa helicase n=1 Tax=Rhodocollybia butyracea TaxID=206335 RepID=A0A9P5PIW3_9AGAR|nr:Sec63 Brl domain-containing protein [Rhodocollybia butyracea]